MAFSGQITNFVSGLRATKQRTTSSAYIQALNPRTDEPVDGQLRRFQYFPETINDVKQNNYQAKEIPGLSHPLYQWVAGGPREISFTAIFSRDLESTPLSSKTPSGVDPTIASIAAGLTSGIGSALAGANGPNGADPRNPDIASAVAWLRQFMYPSYTDQGGTANLSVRPYPPAKLLLTMPGVAMSRGKNTGGGSIFSPLANLLSEDDILCLMTQCDVSYEAFFASGTPRLARVTLAFVETIQKAGGIYPQSAEGRAAQYGTYTLQPYPNR